MFCYMVSGSPELCFFFVLFLWSTSYHKFNKITVFFPQKIIFSPGQFGKKMKLKASKSKKKPTLIWR